MPRKGCLQLHRYANKHQVDGGLKLDPLGQGHPLPSWVERKDAQGRSFLLRGTHTKGRRGQGWTADPEQVHWVCQAVIHRQWGRPGWGRGAGPRETLLLTTQRRGTKEGATSLTKGAPRQLHLGSLAGNRTHMVCLPGSPCTLEGLVSHTLGRSMVCDGSGPQLGGHNLPACPAECPPCQGRMARDHHWPCPGP